MDPVENSGRATGSSETNADLFSGLLAERCDLWQALRGHPVHRPRRAQSSQAASRGVEDGDRNAIEPLFQLPECRSPALNSYALELEAEVFHARDRLLGERLQGILEREVLEAAFGEGEQHLAVGDGVRLGLPACPVAHPHKVGPVDLRDVNDLVVLEDGKVHRLGGLFRQAFHRPPRQLDEIVAGAHCEHSEAAELGTEPKRLVPRGPLEEAPLGERGGEAGDGALVDAEHGRHLAHPVLLVNLLEEEEKLQRAVNRLAHLEPLVAGKWSQTAHCTQR
jgi:hypothetical protein